VSKHLIYLGFTGTAHRLALFDTDNILAKQVPVKDVPELPENVEYLNCTIKDGQVFPNLQGAKVLCTAPKNIDPVFNSTSTQKRDTFMQSLHLWSDVKPTYFYGFSEYEPVSNSNNKGESRFLAGSLMSGGDTRGWNIWNGRCTKDTYYLIANVAVRKNSKRYMVTGSMLGMTSTGKLFFTCVNDIKVSLHQDWVTYVQVGTPVLQHPHTYIRNTSSENKLSVVIIPDDSLDKVIWQGRNRFDESICPKVESVWWNNRWKSTICDLRKYSNARIFGINSIADGSLLIFPESTEEIWFGLLNRCPSIKAIYIPPNVTCIRDFNIPTKRIKQIVFYSSSPAAKQFCEQYGATRIDSVNAEDMLNKFYEASDSDYANVRDVSHIAALAGAQSDKSGETGTVWSAVLFSLKLKGMATDTLQELYPVVDICRGEYAVPKTNIRSMGVGYGDCSGHGQFGKERARVMAAAFTHFYPYSTRECELKHNMIIYDRYRLGDYTLYVGENAFNVYRYLTFKRLPETDKKYVSRAELQRIKEIKGDITALNNVALLVDPRGDVIHRFECGDTIKRVMWGLEGAAFDDTEPSGVLRYADKLPVIFWTRAQDERGDVVKSVFRTFQVFMFSTKASKRQLVGIDLHTGSLATASFTGNTYSDVYNNDRLKGLTSRAKDIVQYFVGVKGLRQLQVHPLDADLSHLFDKNCVYNQRKLGV